MWLANLVIHLQEQYPYKFLVDIHHLDFWYSESGVSFWQLASTSGPGYGCAQMIVFNIALRRSADV